MYRNAYEATLAENIRLKREIDQREVEAENEALRKRLAEMVKQGQNKVAAKARKGWR